MKVYSSLFYQDYAL